MVTSYKASSKCGRWLSALFSVASVHPILTSIKCGWICFALTCQTRWERPGRLFDSARGTTSGEVQRNVNESENKEIWVLKYLSHHFISLPSVVEQITSVSTIRSPSFIIGTDTEPPLSETEMVLAPISREISGIKNTYESVYRTFGVWSQ